MKHISSLSESSRIRTPLENPMTNRSFTAHIAVISPSYPPAPPLAPPNMEVMEPINPVFPLWRLLLSLCSYMNSQLVTSRHSKKLVCVMVLSLYATRSCWFLSGDSSSWSPPPTPPDMNYWPHALFRMNLEANWLFLLLRMLIGRLCGSRCCGTALAYAYRVCRRSSSPPSGSISRVLDLATSFCLK